VICPWCGGFTSNAAGAHLFCERAARLESENGALILAEAAARAALRTACRQYLAVPLPTTREAVARLDVRARDLAARLQAYLDEDAA
jgi:hypothetical protein